MRLSRRPKNGSRCVYETVDRCPTCKAANRETNWGGMTEKAAAAEMKKHVPETAETKAQRGFDFE
jgi:hypothetical protein